jgi:hypothetical protein
MTPTTPEQDPAVQWKSALQLYPIYFELAREFVIDVKACADLEAQVEVPGPEALAQANAWLDEMDERIQVHQLRQFLQTSSLVNQDGLVNLIHHFLAKATRTDAVRDKIDFLLVQHFSQIAPAGVADAEVDLGFVAQHLEPLFGPVEIKPPVWLNALDRVLESARKCRSLDELLHGGVLEQGRKAKGQAGDLFYKPIALVAFTRFGYLMRRAFFRLMLGDLNTILEGLTELEEKDIHTIDCRRAQFSAEEPISRLRMICQSWKVMFQAEYSSGQPLRMLVDLKASVEYALGQGKTPAVPAPAAAPADQTKAAAAATAAPKKAAPPPTPAAPKPAAAVAKSAVAVKPAAKPVEKESAAAAGASAIAGATKSPVPAKSGLAKPKAKFAVAADDAEEFQISTAPDWDPDADSKPDKKK